MVKINYNVLFIFIYFFMIYLYIYIYILSYNYMYYNRYMLFVTSFMWFIVATMVQFMPLCNPSIL